VIIESPQTTHIGDLAVSKWRVHWETANRPSAELYVAVRQDQAHMLHASDHTALLAALPSAALHNEPKLSVSSVDPELLEGLEVVQEYYHHWRDISPVELDTASLMTRPALQPGRSTAAFFSGGIDSLATLRKNVATFPAPHPSRVTHALHVDLAGPAQIEDLQGKLSPRQLEVCAGLHIATSDLGVELVPIVTNIRSLEGYDFNADWMFHSHGTTLAAVAHSFEPAFQKVLIASTYDARHLSPWGSHPLIDGHLSSSAVRIRHHNEQYSRQEKLELVADWPAGLHALDVCFHWKNRQLGKRNCGRCEKCLRTKAGLLAAGKDLTHLGAFDYPDLSIRDLRTLPPLKDEYERHCWAEIEQALAFRQLPQARAIRQALWRDRMRRLEPPLLRQVARSARNAWRSRTTSTADNS